MEPHRIAFGSYTARISFTDADLLARGIDAVYKCTLEGQPIGLVVKSATVSSSHALSFALTKFGI